MKTKTAEECWVSNGLIPAYFTKYVKSAFEEYASQASTVDDESAKEPIQSALYATNKFTVDDCSVLSEGILQYIKDAGYSITSNEYASQGAEAVDVLKEVQQRLWYDTDSEGQPKSSITDIVEMWDKVNKVLHQPSSRHQQNGVAASPVDGREWVRVEDVINWMNTWEQLKDTAIPIRFKEDFTPPKA